TTEPLDAVEYVDTTIGSQRALAVSDGTTYYYTVTAVDAEGDQSPRSAQVSPTLEPAPEPDIDDTARTNTGSTGTAVQSDGDVGTNTRSSSGGCFVSEAGVSLNAAEWPIPTVMGVLALIGLLWLGNKKAKGARPKDKGIKNRLSAFGVRHTVKENKRKIKDSGMKIGA
ncbi:MAG: hypothetical protein JSW26_09095, partial [Desulfobacterales bacterium]